MKKLYAASLTYKKAKVEDLLSKEGLLNKQSVILQFNSKMLENRGNVDHLSKLKQKGFQIIIEINKDDTVFTLTKTLADFIKFDIKDIPVGIINQDFVCKKIAYNVDEAEDYVLVESSDIELYEGNYINVGTVSEVEEIKHSKFNFLEIISTMNKPDANIREITRVIQRDSLMSAQLIRLSNSAYFRSTKRIVSIQDAIVRIGLNNLRKWIFLLQFSTSNNADEEFIREAYQKAIFCERIVDRSKVKGITSDEAYIIGLFSTLDMLTGKPMASEIASLRLSEVIEDALVYRDGIGGTLLNLVKAYEEGKWDRVDKYQSTFKLSKDKIYRTYYDSVMDANKLWDELTKLGGLA